MLDEVDFVLNIKYEKTIILDLFYLPKISTWVILVILW